MLCAPYAASRVMVVVVVTIIIRYGRSETKATFGALHFLKKVRFGFDACLQRPLSGLSPRAVAAPDLSPCLLASHLYHQPVPSIPSHLYNQPVPFSIAPLPSSRAYARRCAEVPPLEHQAITTLFRSLPISFWVRCCFRSELGTRAFRRAFMPTVTVTVTVTVTMLSSFSTFSEKISAGHVLCHRPLQQQRARVCPLPPPTITAHCSLLFAHAHMSKR